MLKSKHEAISWFKNIILMNFVDIAPRHNHSRPAINTELMNTGIKTKARFQSSQSVTLLMWGRIWQLSKLNVGWYRAINSWVLGANQTIAQSKYTQPLARKKNQATMTERKVNVLPTNNPTRLVFGTPVKLRHPWFKVKYRPCKPPQNRGKK